MGPAAAVAEGATAREVARVLVDEGVPGAAVVDADAVVVGLVTENCLALGGRSRLRSCFDEPHSVTAGELMERHFTTADADEPLSAVVERMERRGVVLAVVHTGETVVGLLGVHDLLRPIAGVEPGPRQVGPLRFGTAVVRLPAGRGLGWLLE